MLAMLASQSNFSEADVANIMKQVVSAVKYCHKKRIAHRDLKPDNILFVKRDITSNLKVIDFGHSKVLRMDQRLKDLSGTV